MSEAQERRGEKFDHELRKRDTELTLRNIAKTCFAVLHLLAAQRSRFPISAAVPDIIRDWIEYSGFIKDNGSESVSDGLGDLIREIGVWV